MAPPSRLGGQVHVAATRLGVSLDFGVASRMSKHARDWSGSDSYCAHFERNLSVELYHIVWYSSRHTSRSKQSINLRVTQSQPLRLPRACAFFLPFSCIDADPPQHSISAGASLGLGRGAISSEVAAQCSRFPALVGREGKAAPQGALEYTHTRVCSKRAAPDPAHVPAAVAVGGADEPASPSIRQPTNKQVLAEVWELARAVLLAGRPNLIERHGAARWYHVRCPSRNSPKATKGGDPRLV